MERFNTSFLTEILPQDVINLWRQTVRPINLYIHSPFCKSICRFCAYRGKVPLNDDMDRYYESILPKQILAYRNILETKNISSCFFGGGTPSLMQPKHLNNILNLIPGIADIREKYFEVHPAFVSFELLDILAEYNFNNIIIGVQSFNHEVLDKTNRIYASEKIVRDLIDEIHLRGMFAWLDIVGFVNEHAEELPVFKQDIEIAIALSPDEISICPNFNYKKYISDSAIDLIYNCIKHTSAYQLVDGCPISFDLIQQTYNQKKAIRLFKINSAILDFARYIIKNDCPDVNKESVLGIGSYENENRDTISIFSGEDSNYIYVERLIDGNIKYFRFSR